MTLLEINLTDVLSETDPDDRVLVWAPAFREGATGGLVGPRQKAIPLVDGVGSDEVVPGPLMVQVRCKAMSDTHPREVVVPEEGPVTLTDLLDLAGAFTYAPPVVGQVALDAQRAKDAAVRAESVADSVYWQDDRLSVMGQLGPSLTGPKGDPGDGSGGGSGDGSGDVLWSDLNPVLDGKASVSHTHTVSEITNLPEIRSSAAPDSLALRSPTGNILVATTPSGPSSATSQAYVESYVASQMGAAPVSHTHTAEQISDATTVGRNVLTAADATAARGAIGAGTSDLAIGTTSSTAKAGDWKPAAADITDATAIGQSVVKAATTAAARTAIGAGTSNLALGATASTAKAGDYAPTWSEVTSRPSTFPPSAHTHPATDISDSTSVGRSVLTAVDAAAARTAIGAGTSNLSLGTTSTTAKAGNWKPAVADVTGLSAALAVRSTSTATPAGGTITLTAPASPVSGQMHIFEILPTASTTVTVSALGPRADGVLASLTVEAGGVGLVGARWSSSKASWHVLTASVVN